jgi:hypothetical protein
MRRYDYIINLFIPKKKESPWLSPKNSIRINKEKAVPINPAKRPKIKYKKPISLWFVE